MWVSAGLGVWDLRYAACGVPWPSLPKVAITNLVDEHVEPEERARWQALNDKKERLERYPEPSTLNPTP
jgi:hypothetical protein